ncbi:MAG: GNAT family N-acetyltransferase, partial [Chloroflexi bacterium]|nr:GNAT family N-acetyltransferase [Chloroflexota bacterium]
MEVHVRSARLTDLDAVIRILARGDDDETGRRDVDYLRNLLFVPSATVAVAERDRRVVGVGVLAIRPSVRSGPFVGIIDELGIAEKAVLGTADWRRTADGIVEQLATSARNKGCTRVEVSEPLASAEPSLWKRLGFASRGRTLGRS